MNTSLQQRDATARQACGRITLFLLVAISATGCEFGGRNGAAEPVEVAPLSEAAFDEFATGIATQLDALLQQEQYPLPVNVTPPVVVSGPEDSRDARRFARVLANGLTDRMQGAVRFVTPRREGPRLESRLEFTGASGAGPRRITFEVLEGSARQSMVREEFEYDGIAARPPPRAARPPASESVPEIAAADPVTPAQPPSEPEPLAAAPPPPPVRDSRSRSAERIAGRSTAADTPSAPGALPPGSTPLAPLSQEPESDNTRREPLEIDYDEVGFAEHVRRNLPGARQVLRGRSGMVVFVDMASANRFVLQSQRAGRTQNGRLRVELDLRARDREREANIRVAFLDDLGQQVEVTPVLQLDISARLLESLSVSSIDPRAASYLCLIEED